MLDFLIFNSAFHSRRHDQLQITSPHMRIGVASIAAWVRKMGANVEIVDMQAGKISAYEAVDNVITKMPRYVCFSAYTEEIHDAARLAGMIKERTNGDQLITTVLGGYHVSALPQETLQAFPCFDIGIVGEGERPLAELFSNRPPEEVSGTVYRDDKGNITFNSTQRSPFVFKSAPVPSWDLYDLNQYRHPLPIEPLRGCPFSCNFCFRTFGKQCIFKDPCQFVDELEFLMKEFGVRRFRFVAGTFPLRKTHTEKICREIISRKLPILWDASTRVDTLDEALIPLLKSAGCASLQLGIESGSVELLKESSKGITPEQAVATAKRCKNAGLPIGLNFIIGLPNETKATAKSTLALALRLRKYAIHANFAILVPFPGTEVCDMALKQEGGISFADSNWSDFGKQSGLALAHKNFKPGELQRLQSEFYFRYYVGAPTQALRMFSFRKGWLMAKRLFAR